VEEAVVDGEAVIPTVIFDEVVHPWESVTVTT
jgi:hypothetical protein